MRDKMNYVANTISADELHLAKTIWEGFMQAKQLKQHPFARRIPEMWLRQVYIFANKPEDKENEVTLSTIISQPSPMIPMTQFSSFDHLKWVTAGNIQKRSSQKSSLSTEELKGAEIYWLELIQTQHFSTEIEMIQKKGSISKSSSLLPLQLILQPIFYVLVADSNCLKLRIRLNILSYYMGKIRSHMQSSEMSTRDSSMQAQLCCPVLFVGNSTSLVVGRRSD